MEKLKAKMGDDNSNLKYIMGKHRLGTMNENGELLTNFCTHHILVIGGTISPTRESIKSLDKLPSGIADIASERCLLTETLQRKLASTNSN